MLKQVAITLWSVGAACLFAFDLAALVAHYWSFSVLTAQPAVRAWRATDAAEEARDTGGVQQSFRRAPPRLQHAL